MYCNNIVSRTKTGKLFIIPAKMEIIDRNVTYRLGELAQDFHSGRLREQHIFNAHETLFVIHLKINRTLAVRGDQQVKYADVASRNKSMTLTSLLTSMCDGIIGIPVLISRNTYRFRPICGLDVSVLCISIRSTLKRWMDSGLFVDWINERRILRPLHNSMTRVLL